MVNGVDAALAVAAFLDSDGAMLLDQARLRVRARTRSQEPCFRHARRTYLRAPMQIHRTRARANKPIALAGWRAARHRIGYSMPVSHRVGQVASVAAQVGACANPSMCSNAELERWAIDSFSSLAGNIRVFVRVSGLRLCAHARVRVRAWSAAGAALPRTARNVLPHAGPCVHAAVQCRDRPSRLQPAGECLRLPFCSITAYVLQHADELAALMGADASALHAEANAAANAANGCKGLPVGVATSTCQLGDLQQWALANGRLEPGLLGG